MSWVRVDDNITFHRKVVHAGNEAFGAWMRMVAWSANHLTDGVIPHRIAMLIAEKEKVVETLVAAGLLQRTGEDFLVHDYHDHNPTADDVKAKRRAESERKAAGRSGQGRDTSGRITADVRAESGRTNSGRPAGQNAESARNPAVRPPVPFPSPSPSPSRPKEQDPEKTLADLSAGDRVSGPEGLALVPTEPSVTDADLEGVYKLYPRREGKTDGLKRLKPQIKTRAQLAELERAVRNYAAQVSADATEPGYIKHFSTWTSTWRDWIAWEVKAPAAPAAKPIQGRAQPVGVFSDGITRYSKQGVTHE
jgi:hypothetical protein